MISSSGAGAGASVGVAVVVGAAVGAAVAVDSGVTVVVGVLVHAAADCVVAVRMAVASGAVPQAVRARDRRSSINKECFMSYPLYQKTTGSLAHVVL